MVLPSILNLIPPAVLFALTVIITFLSWNNKGIKILVSLLTVLIIYGVINVIIQNQESLEKVSDLLRYRTMLWGLVAPLSYHSVISILKEREKKWQRVLIYLYTAGFAIIVLSLSGYSIFREYKLTSWGWNAIMNPGSWFFWFLHSYLVTGVAAFILSLFEIRQQTENYRIRKLANAILINFIWGGSFTIIPYFILSFFNIPTEVLLIYAGNIAMFLIVFAIQKYQPDNYSAVGFLSNISPIMPAHVIMLSPDKIITWISQDKILLNGFSRKDLEGANYKKLFVHDKMVDDELDKIITNPNYSSSFECECNSNNGNTIRLKINISGLRNKFNDIIAFLVVLNNLVKDNDWLSSLQNNYKLSEREKEVAELLNEGYSNLEICDRLFISLNTIKTHIRNIYQKIGVANRSEFKNLCRSFINSVKVLS